MTQDERWLQQWQTVMDFMEAKKRRCCRFCGCTAFVGSERLCGALATLCLKRWWIFYA